MPVASCACFATPYHSLESTDELGMDEYFAEVSLLTCSLCGQKWLRYLYEVEAFTASGRWYLGAIPSEQAMILTAENAKEALEKLNWYFYGGSYFGGRIGKASGRINLNP
jgi:hypothetical protein